MNSQNNGDPEAIELGARMLAEVKMRNASAPASSTSHSAPSLLQPMGSPPGGHQMYGQPPMRTHDPWRTGGVAGAGGGPPPMNAYGAPQPMMQSPPMAGDNTGGYGNYQMPDQRGGPGSVSWRDL